MKHEITLDDMSKALDTLIQIAGCASSVKKASKGLWFNPASLKYTVIYRKTDGSEKKENQYLDPLIAMGIYNEYNV